jgi:di/tricarboxylate transporter
MAWTIEQAIVFGVLAASLILFVWGRWRYDVVALLALLVVGIAGLVPPRDVFAGFGHPAVVTVAAVLVVSRGLHNAGVVNSIAKCLSHVGARPTVQVATLTAVVAICSAFMNNVGALALLMPVAIWMARQSGRSPSLLLMPLAFGSLLGGMLTLIGTPPNIIIASFRAQTGATPFGMFDFAPVGAGVLLVGLLFIALLGWRLTPERKSQASPEELFQIESYVSELRVPPESKLVGQTLHYLETQVVKDTEATVLGLIRGDRRLLVPSGYEIIQADDILLMESDPEDLKTVLDAAGLELAESKDTGNGKLDSEEVELVETVVAADARILGTTAAELDLRERHGINLLAVARQGQQLRERLSQVRFLPGDILLLQGRKQALQETLPQLGCLPLAGRGLRLGKPRRLLWATGIFAAALVLTSCSVLPVQIALTAAAVAMVLMGLVSLTEAYSSIDWPILVLLGAMIPIGQALETTGGAQKIADHLLVAGAYFSPAMMVGTLLVGTMLLSNVINNAAAAVLMAPVGIGVARGLSLSADPFLMAVAVGASSAFLTPIGHQSSTLVMAPGGYRFGDYWRMGLPLSVIVTGVSVPLILWFWPL